MTSRLSHIIATLLMLSSPIACSSVHPSIPPRPEPAADDRREGEWSIDFPGDHPITILKADDRPIRIGDVIGFTMRERFGPPVESIQIKTVDDNGCFALPLTKTFHAAGRTGADMLIQVRNRYRQMNINLGPCTMILTLNPPRNITVRRSDHPGSTVQSGNNRDATGD